MHVLASIPSPTRSVWHLGPFPVRAYALCIIVGIVVAIWLTTRRWRERGGNPDHVWDVAGWAILFGIIGGRLYHVATDPELYFKAGKHPLNALKIWDGGLGIWGAIALGGVGAWIGCRRRGVKLAVFADACVPGVVFAQAIGRLGNWFNNELYGATTTLPWRLEIHCLNIDVGHAQNCPGTNSTVLGYFQPTFLYELLWDAAVGIALILLDRRLRLGRGNVLALYVMGYTLGRVWIEMLRTDTANHILGVRLNVWTSIVVFLLGLAWFVTHGGFHARREATPYTNPPPDPDSIEPADRETDEASEPTAREEDKEARADGRRDR
ncbi:MAG: prolipoprotein diacylglyceryl transferase [Actinomycetota bacterium]|nr:prolipoprotein diacylglyceryl transferase [Actinomycetota bacterium]